MPEQPQVPQGVLARVSRIRHFRLLAGGFAAAVFLITFATVGASPAGVPALSEVLGLSGEHGTAVSDAVHDAKDSVAEGDKVGPAVSEAACTAAHKRTNLPDGAQKAPGQVDKESKDCTHPSNAVDDSEAANGTETADDAIDHGQSVSTAVHDAKAGVADGDKVGPAVSEAACKAAHDRNTLPEDAKLVPPGQVDKESKDCTHPSNQDGAGDSGVTGASDAKGKAAAPGQLKKNSD